jgi:CMP-2-keto-3-deoxyoctulosonic acid synthetase
MISCWCRADVVIATDKEDVVEVTKEVTGAVCLFPCFHGC